MTKIPTPPLKTSLLLAGLFLILIFKASAKEDKYSLSWLAFDNLNQNTEHALDYAKQLTKLAQEEQDTVYWSYALRVQGLIHLRYLNYSASLHLFEKAYRLAPNDYNILYNLANTHRLAGNYKKSKYFIQKALETDEERKSILYGCLGFIFLENNQLKKAEETFYKELSLCKDVRDSIITYTDLSYYYIVVEEYPKAKKYLLKTEEILDEYLKIESGNKQYIVSNLYSNWGQYYLGQKDFQKAEQHFLKALQIAEKLHFGIVLEESYQGMQAISVHKQDLAMSNYYMQKQKEFAEKNTKQLSAYYEYLLKNQNQQLGEKEQALVASSQERAEENRKWELMLMGVGLLFVLLLGLLAISMYRIYKTNKKVEALEKDLHYTEVEKTRLITELSTRLNLKD